MNNKAKDARDLKKVEKLEKDLKWSRALGKSEGVIIRRQMVRITELEQKVRQLEGDATK